tara:strand:- start:4781 stop:5959 length:1179 start_codon:yes stop_codon:yes gene_type:complete
MNKDFVSEAKKIEKWVIEIRREIHKHPEIMYEEVKTSELIREKLDEMGVDYEYPIAKTGILAQVGTGSSPCIALRADMDALPIQEENDLDFKSVIDGKMHACGHDCHVAMLLGAVRVFKKHEKEINGTIKFLFQPAEEGGAGGLKMTEEGVLKNPNVKSIFGLHVWPTLPTGSIGARSGTFLASAGFFEIVVKGRGGHAAMPNLSIDPITATSQIISSLQNVVSREIDPLEPAVLSVTYVNGGKAHNVIPEFVKIGGTIRSLTFSGQEKIQKRVEEITKNISIAHDCEAEVAFPGHVYPPTVNDSKHWEMIKEKGKSIFSENIVELDPVMGGEDFSYYTQVCPGCFVALGIGNEEKETTTSVHNPKFKVDEDALHLGVALHLLMATEALNGF